jgi:hypothetical protein
MRKLCRTLNIGKTVLDGFLVLSAGVEQLRISECSTERAVGTEVFP